MATRALRSKLSSFSLRPLIVPVEQVNFLPRPVIAGHGGRRSMSSDPTNTYFIDYTDPFYRKGSISFWQPKDGRDFKHWLVVMDPPPGDASNPDITRDEIIDVYIKTLAKFLGSEEARMKIYSVSTRHYFAFGALISEQLAYEIEELPYVRKVHADCWLDEKNKEYGGEPFINGNPVPYDPKYHEEWLRNKALVDECRKRDALESKLNAIPQTNQVRTKYFIEPLLCRNMGKMQNSYPSIPSNMKKYQKCPPNIDPSRWHDRTRENLQKLQNSSPRHLNMQELQNSSSVPTPSNNMQKYKKTAGLMLFCSFLLTSVYYADYFV